MASSSLSQAWDWRCKGANNVEVSWKLEVSCRVDYYTRQTVVMVRTLFISAPLLLGQEIVNHVLDTLLLRAEILFRQIMVSPI